MKIRNLLIGISGSIAAINIHQYIQKLIEEYNCSISIIATKSACSFININALRYFINGEIFTELSDAKGKGLIPHVQLTQSADLFLILPSTSNVIGKVANGIMDDLLTNSILASSCPVVFVPNVNETVSKRLVYKRNIQLLKDEGFIVLESEQIGYQLSSGKSISGVMPDPYSLISLLEEVLPIEL